MKKRLVFLASLTILLGAACGQPGSSENNDNAIVLISASADTTAATGSANTSMVIDMDMPQGAFSMNAEGAIDFANQKAHMTMHMDMPAAAGLGAMDMEIIQDGLVVYMKYPALPGMPATKPWIKMDLEKMGADAGLDMGGLMQGGTSDPSQMLEFLRGVADIDVVGDEEIRGASATHYKGTLDFDKIIEEAPAETRKVLEASIDQMSEMVGSPTIPVDVWIDDEGRVVRMKESFELSEGEADGTTMNMTIDFFDFGTPVEIEIPPASQISDFQDVMGQMGTSSGSKTYP